MIRVNSVSISSVPGVLLGFNFRPRSLAPKDNCLACQPPGIRPAAPAAPQVQRLLIERFETLIESSRPSSAHDAPQV